MVCEACIAALKVKEDVCPDPECRAAPFESCNLSRYERIKLNETAFNCYKCKEQFIYEERAKHQETCESHKGPCPTRCGEMGIKTEADLEGHLEVCPNVVRACTCHSIPEMVYVLQDARHACTRLLNEGPIRDANVLAVKTRSRLEVMVAQTMEQFSIQQEELEKRVEEISDKLSKCQN